MTDDFDDFAGHGDIEITKEMKEEISRRLELLKQNPQTAISLQQFKGHIQARIAEIGDIK